MKLQPSFQDPHLVHGRACFFCGSVGFLIGDDDDLRGGSELLDDLHLLHGQVALSARFLEFGG